MKYLLWVPGGTPGKRDYSELVLLPFGCTDKWSLETSYNPNASIIIHIPFYIYVYLGSIGPVLYNRLLYVCTLYGYITGGRP